MFNYSVSHLQFVKFSKFIFGIFFTAVIILSLFSSFVTPESSLWNVKCGLWLAFSSLILLVGTIVAKDMAYVFQWLLNTNLCLFYFPRFVSYMLFAKKISIPLVVDIASSDVEKAMRPFGIFIFIITFSLIVCSKINFLQNVRIISVEKFKNIASPLGLIILILLAGIFEMFVTYGLGVSPYGNLKFANANGLMMALKGVLSLDIVFFIALFISWNYTENEFKKNILIIFISVLYVLFMSCLGSRAATIRVFMYSCFFFTFFSRTIYIKSVALLLFVLVVLIPVSTDIANNVRTRIASVESVNVAVISNNASPAITATVEKLNRPSSIVDRFGIADFFVIVSSRVSLNYYLSSEYFWKSSVNMLLPGVPYTEANISQSRLLPVLLGIWDINFVKRSDVGYFSAPLTLWGQTYISFGVLWGAFFLLLCMILLLFVTKFLFDSLVRHSILCTFLPFYLSFIISGFFGLFSFDQYIFLAVLFTIQFVISYYLIKLTSFVGSKIQMPYSWRSRWEST